MSLTKLAICGKIRSGKSEVERHLVLSHGFRSKAFGGALKYYADKVFSHTPEFNQPMDFGRRKPRALYQHFGQACREIDDDVWIRHVAFAYEMAQNDRTVTGFVVSDLRQPNEYEWLRANGFTIIRVTAQDELRRSRAQKAGDVFTDKDFEHDTESHVDGFAVDYEVANDGSVAELYRQVDEVVAQLSAVRS